MIFCKIHYLFIRNICVKFGIPYFSQSQDIGQNFDGDISDCPNSRAGNDIEMKLGPVNKRDKRNTAT